MSQKLKVSICMPVYKGSHLLPKTLESIYRQNFPFHELVVGDDNPPDAKEEARKTREIFQQRNDDRIVYLRNPRNMGYANNLKNIVAHATGDVIFLFAQDDIMSKDGLRRTHDAFLVDDDVGVVTRPLFWFMKDYHKVERVVLPPSLTQDTVISVDDGREAFLKVFESVGQLSGLAYRRAFLDVPFHEECFPAHIYPFAGIFRKHKCVFLKDFTVAVGIEDSQTRFVSSIYDISPTDSWIRMFQSVFADQRLQRQRQWGVRCIASHHEGLVQIKCHARKGLWSREVGIMLRGNPGNLLNPRFYLFLALTGLVPRQPLRRLVDWYKSNILASGADCAKVTFNY